jgi:hypothetical protein
MCWSEKPEIQDRYLMVPLINKRYENNEEKETIEMLYLK